MFTRLFPPSLVFFPREQPVTPAAIAGIVRNPLRKAGQLGQLISIATSTPRDKRLGR